MIICALVINRNIHTDKYKIREPINPNPSLDYNLKIQLVFIYFKDPIM